MWVLDQTMSTPSDNGSMWGNSIYLGQSFSRIPTTPSSIICNSAASKGIDGSGTVGIVRLCHGHKAPVDHPPAQRMTIWMVWFAQTLGTPAKPLGVVLPSVFAHPLA